MGAGGAAAPPPADPVPFVAPTPVPVPLDEAEIAFAIGDPAAQVTIVEYTDYQCPFCQRHALETWPAIIESLIDSGRVYYVFKDLPLDQLHPEARTAAIAARCGGAQGLFLEMHDEIFNTQAEWSGIGADAAKAYFQSMANGKGLDADAFSSCMSGNEVVTAVQRNVEEALSYGLNSTPSFLIDGYPMAGAQPFEVFELVVNLAENDELDEVFAENARQAQEQAQAQPTPSGPTGPVEIPIENVYALGDPEAPIVLVEYTDFQCPFCARHHAQTFPASRRTSLILVWFIMCSRITR